MNRDPKHTWPTPVRLAIGVALALCVLAPAQAQSLLTTNGNFFAWPDTQAPGLPGVYFGGNVDFVSMAEDGTLAFRADLYGAGTSGINSRALFTGANTATLAMLARWNDPAPGLPGLSLMNATGTQGIGSAVSISPSGGYTLWSSPLSGPGVTTNNDTAMFRGSPGGHALIAREGDPAPGTAGAVYVGNKQADYQFAKINRNGTVLFYSQLAGGDVVVDVNDYAYFIGTPGAISILVRQGATVLPGGVTAWGLGYTWQLDNNGRVLYNLPLAGPGVTSANDDSVWLYTPGSGSQLLVREGDPAPGTAGATLANVGDGVGFPGISQASLTRSGRYEFTADLTGGDVNPGVNDRALYAGTVGGGLTLIARRGQAAPGTDAVFAGFSPFYSLINDAGDVAFQAMVSGGTSNLTNDTGIWIWRSGTMSLAAREGGPVPVVPPGLETPGIAPGTTFDSFIGWNMAFNDLGQLVVHAGLMGGDVIPGIDHNALLAWDPTKGLFLAARAAEEIEGLPGNFRTSRLFSFLQFNNSDGVSGLGKTGKLGLLVFFTEGAAVATVELNCYPSTAYGTDSDGDGKGDPATRVDVCSGATPPAGKVPNATDCNDGNPAVWAAYYRDADGDGYGDPALPICDDATPPAGYVIKKTDCDDTKAVVHPGAADSLCDGLDNNCNFQIDEGFLPYDTFCGVGACTSMGTAECAGGVFSDSCTPSAPSTETCNGVDDNCDGTIDNAAIPTGTPSVTLSRISGSAATLAWSNVSGATGYDITRGSLVTLRSSLGNFTTATTNCLGNNVAATTVNDLQGPAVGQGFWYVLRAVSCGGGASYDSGAPKQVGSRDAEIMASGLACP